MLGDVTYYDTMPSDSEGRGAIQRGMPRPPSTMVQTPLRIPSEWIAEADELAKLMARPGFSSTRSEVLRAAIAKGLTVLRAELADEKKPTKRR